MEPWTQLTRFFQTRNLYYYDIKFKIFNYLNNLSNKKYFLRTLFFWFLLIIFLVLGIKSDNLNTRSLLNIILFSNILKYYREPSSVRIVFGMQRFIVAFKRICIIIYCDNTRARCIRTAYFQVKNDESPWNQDSIWTFECKMTKKCSCLNSR